MKQSLTKTLIQILQEEKRTTLILSELFDIKKLELLFEQAIKERDKEVLGEELDDLFCEIRGLLKEHSIFPEQWDTDERLRAWLKEKGEL